MKQIVFGPSGGKKFQMTVWVHRQSFLMEHIGRKLLIVFVLLAAALAAFLVMSPVYAQTPTDRTISFSARLKSGNGTPVPDGLYNISFRLYEANEAGMPLWAETYYDENGTIAGQDHRVRVSGGYLNVQLGSRTAFGNSVDWNKNLWLTMNVGSTGQIATVENIPWDGEMSPRIQLSAVPYAMNAGMLGGRTADDFIQLGGGVQTNSSDNPSIHINNTGTGNLVQLQHNAEDVFTVDRDGNITFGGGSDHTISIDESDPGNDGKALVISGGDGGEGDTDGGNVIISGGSGSGSGADGLVVLATTAFATATDDANCHPGGTLAVNNCTITQSTVDSSSAVLIGFSETDRTATLPNPTLTTPGRILYIMAANDSLAFSLIVNGGESLSLQAKTALTMLWNGSAWVVASHNGAPSPPGTAPPQGPAITEDDTESPPIMIQDEIIAPEVTAPDEGDITPTIPALPLKLAELDGAPPATPGTMYYDTTLGKVQCLEANGWGACGDAPDTFVAISPEYTNAVMNGADIGVISSDFCSGTLGINDGSNSQLAVCGANETYNFYRWTTEESEDQTRSIYLTYQLPDNFRSFVPAATAIMGRTDSNDATVSYQIYRDSGAGLLSCGPPVKVSSGLQSSWQRGLAENESDPADCEFEAGDSILFRVNLAAKDGANAFVSNVNFIFRNN